MAYRNVPEVKGNVIVSNNISANAQNACTVLNHIGGIKLAREMAVAASEVYKEKERFDNKTDATQPAWPVGWTLVGEAGYGVVNQTGGRQEHQGYDIQRHTVSLLKCNENLMIACRGTTSGEWTTDLNLTHERFKIAHAHDRNGLPYGGTELGKTHAGFNHHVQAIFFGYGAGRSLAQEVLHRSPTIIYVTGHSLGGATAHLGALALAQFFIANNKPVPQIKVLSFAAPRVCNCYFPPNKLQQSFDTLNIQGVRIVNMLDPVPNTPGVSGAGIRGGFAGFRDYGGHYVGGAGGLVTGVVGVTAGAVGDILSVFGGLGGRWAHPSFKKLRFKDNGREIGGHPHSMNLYRHILVDRTDRLDRDLQDSILGRT